MDLVNNRIHGDIRAPICHNIEESAAESEDNISFKWPTPKAFCDATQSNVRVQ